MSSTPYKRASVPEPPENDAEIPLNTPIVLKRAESGSTEYDTTYGRRSAIAVHVWTFDPTTDEAYYRGMVNVFWSVVRRQIDAALQDLDTLLPCYVVAVGERARRELREPQNPEVGDRAVQAVADRIIEDLDDAPEGDPFNEPPAPF